MSVSQGIRGLPGNANDFFRRQLSFSSKPFVERLAFQELHGQEGNAMIVINSIDGDDMVMLKRRR